MDRELGPACRAPRPRGTLWDSEAGSAGVARPPLQFAERYLQESPLPQRRAETPRSALPIPGREAFVRGATPIRNNGCIVRKDVRDEFLENFCCRFPRGDLRPACRDRD